MEVLCQRIITTAVYPRRPQHGGNPAGPRGPMGPIGHGQPHGPMGHAPMTLTQASSAGLFAGVFSPMKLVQDGPPYQL